MMSQFSMRRIGLAVALVLALLGVLAVTDYLVQLKRSEGRIPPGTEASIGGQFALVDASGRTVTERDFADRYKLIFFGFTHCPDVCPTTLARMSVILRALGPAATRLYPLFVTVDPERDTPERLREYARQFDPRIIYLTGTPDQIAKVLEAWRVSTAKIAAGQDDYSMNHSAVLYLMTPAGQLAASFRWDDAEADIADDIRGYLSD
ncbi:MAG: SCO family protein [Pseudomonadota bacterium]